jgi:hypothetical protein
MSYTTCWKCHIKGVIRSSMLKMKKFIQHHRLKLDIKAYIIYCKYCKKHKIPKDYRKDLWVKYYDDIWHDKAMRKCVRGVR